MTEPILIAWSGGKDCLMALARLRADARWTAVALLTTVTRNFDRVSMHGIRRDVLRAQAASLRMPLIECAIDWPSSNEAYEAAYAQALRDARRRWPGLRHCAFGDLFLDDVRAWRENQLARAGWIGIFPLWGSDTRELSHEFLAHGNRAVLTCVDTTQLDASFSGREYDEALLEALPATVDPCGEHGEFHTLSRAGPLFSRPLVVQRGESVLRDGRFQYTDFTLPPHRTHRMPRTTPETASVAPATRKRLILPDVLAPGLRVVFCGTAPGTRSAVEGAYYAHPGNYFWRTLHEVGLTPVRLPPAEFRRVLGFGIGLTDVAKHHFGSDAALPPQAFDAKALHRKIARYRPRIVAFTSKNAALAVLDSRPRDLEYGEQSVQIAGSRVFVLPSPSGQARGFWNIAPWRELAAHARRRCP
ncbi:MAG: uracil-DNA glycosylase family protein [Rhodanobacteraceae bacterium]